MYYPQGRTVADVEHQQRIQWHFGHDMGVDDLHHGTRAYNCITIQLYNRNRDWTADDVARLSRKELMGIPNMGKRSANWVVRWLAAHGRTLRDE